MIKTTAIDETLYLNIHWILFMYAQIVMKFRFLILSLFWICFGFRFLKFEFILNLDICALSLFIV